MNTDSRESVTRHSRPLIQIAVLKGRGVSGSFYKNVVLKKLRTNIREVCPKTGLQHVHLLHDNAPAHKSLTVAKFLKSEKVNVLSHPVYHLAQFDFFLFPKLKKKQPYLARNIGSEVHWGLQFT